MHNQNEYGSTAEIMARLREPDKFIWYPLIVDYL
jgi:hypothetical protein